MGHPDVIDSSMSKKQDMGHPANQSTWRKPGDPVIGWRGWTR